MDHLTIAEIYAHMGYRASAVVGSGEEDEVSQLGVSL